MISVKNIFKKENLIAAGGLGAGSLAAEIVASKVTPMLTNEAGEVSKIVPAIPILAGFLLSGSTGFVGSIGKGMLAQGVGAVAKQYIPLETKTSLGLGEDVMMGNVMMGEPPLAGFSSDSYDYTSGDAGEMNY